MELAALIKKQILYLRNTHVVKLHCSCYNGHKLENTIMILLHSIRITVYRFLHFYKRRVLSAPKGFYYPE